MANIKIKILRGLKKDLPLLDRGEIAFCTDTEELFAGDGEKNILLSLSKEQFDELYKTTEALEIVDTEVVVPGPATANSGIPFTKEILENITLSVTQHDAFGDLDILVDGVPQETYITWEDRGGYFYLNVDYPNVTQFNWVFVYEDGESTWWGYSLWTVQGDIYDTAMLGSTTFLISANVPFSIDRQFVLLDEVYKKNEIDTKFDEVYNLVGEGGSGGGEVDLNAMSYFNYASSIYGDKYNLLVSAWEHSLTVDPEEISEDGSYSNPRGKAQYPNGEAEGIIIPQGVTRIGDYAFCRWEANNQPLVIPNSVTSIGEAAFSDWSSNNQPLTIPNSVTNISDNAFVSWTSNNQPLVIPDSVTSIGQGSFSDWSSNNQPLVIPNSVTSIDYAAFSHWSSNNHPLVIPNSVTNISTYAFFNWSKVPYVEIRAITPPTLANTNAFNNQNNAPIYVPDESVDDYKEATNWVDLADRIFPISDKLTTSGGEVDLNEMSYFDYAGSIYGDKYSLLVSAWEHSLTVDPEEIEKAQYPNGENEGVIIPHGVTSIRSDAFYNWQSNNQPLVIPNSVTSIGAYAFSTWQSNNQPLVIPNSVINIGSMAFSNWTSNNQPLIISNSVTSISDTAFNNWASNNQPLVIPNSVTSIGYSAFNNWASNNQPLVIPDSVTSIRNYAFAYWEAVPYIEMKATTPPSLSNANAFSNQNNAPIYVPDESVTAYKTAPKWADLADRIFPMSDKEGISASDIIDDLTSTDTNKPLSANQGKVLNDTTAKLAESNVFTQPQQVPSATLPQHAVNKLQVETMFEMFKRQLRGYNLAMPDLEGKEYLGDGVYRLYNDNGITIDYNVNSGIYAINGTNTSNLIYTLFDIEENTEYTISYIHVSGVFTSSTLPFVARTPYLFLFSRNETTYNVSIETTFNTTTQTRVDLDIDSTVRTYDNFQFRLQLEKGDTATPYTVPGQIPQYKIVGEE